MWVVHFLEAHPSRDDRIPNSPDIRNLSADWTRESRRLGTTQVVETPQRAPHDDNCLRRRAQLKIVEGLLADRRSNHMHPFDCCASLHLMEESSLAPQEKKTIRHTKKQLEDPIREWHRPLHERGWCSHSGTRLLFVREVVEDSPSVVPHERLCDERNDTFPLLATWRNPLN